MKKNLIKLGFYLFAWIFVFILATFICGSLDWINSKDVFSRFAYCFICILSNVFIIGGEYL